MKNVYSYPISPKNEIGHACTVQAQTFSISPHGGNDTSRVLLSVIFSFPDLVGPFPHAQTIPGAPEQVSHLSVLPVFDHFKCQFPFLTIDISPVNEERTYTRVTLFVRSRFWTHDLYDKNVILQASNGFLYTTSQFEDIHISHFNVREQVSTAVGLRFDLKGFQMSNSIWLH